MGQKYFTVPTEVGQRKILQHAHAGTKLNVTRFAVGDAGGIEYIPTPDMTELKNKVWEGSVTHIEIADIGKGKVTYKASIDANDGVFSIREIAVFDDEGDMVAVANTPLTEQTDPSTGALTGVTVSLTLVTDYLEAISLVVDTSVVGATKQDIAAHNQDEQAHPATFVKGKNYRIYSSFEELGIIPGKETLVDIVHNMSDYSELIVGIKTMPTPNPYPHGHGILKVTKYIPSRCVMTYHTVNIAPREWHNTVYDDGGVIAFSGWKEELFGIHSQPHFYVSKTGNDTTGTGTVNQPFFTINKAINESRKAFIDTEQEAVIYIGEGIYDEAVYVNYYNKPLNLISNPRDSSKTIILRGVQCYDSLHTTFTGITVRRTPAPGASVLDIRNSTAYISGSVIEPSNKTNNQYGVFISRGYLSCSNCVINNTQGAVVSEIGGYLHSTNNTGTNNDVALRCNSGILQTLGTIPSANVEQSIFNGGQIFKG